MGILNFLPIIGKIVDRGMKVIDDLVLDKGLAAKLKNEIRERILIQDHEENMELIKAQMSIIMAETKGMWLQRNWRPGLMALFGIIILNNYILNPWLSAMFSVDIMMDIPPDMWQLLKIGMGGYIAGRSIEKGIEVWKNNKQ